MSKTIDYYKCLDSRQNCMANNGGLCVILDETYPAGVECPFYKTYEQFRKEIDELKAKGHISLINRRNY